MHLAVIKSVCIESTTHCQLACPGCRTASHEIDATCGKGILAVDAFENFLDRHPDVNHVELSNNGEMFMHPRLGEILRIAHERNVRLTAGNGVNFNHASVATLEDLVKYGFFGMAIALDGASEESYGRYRKQGKFSRVIANIEELNRIKQAHGSELPHLVWQFIVFRHNESEMGTAALIARRLGMAIRFKLQWDDHGEPLANTQMAERVLGGLTRADFAERHGIHYMAPVCTQLWNAPVINWDGSMLGCCKNWWQPFDGNVFKDGLPAVMKSERLERTRQALMGLEALPEDSPCRRCDVFQWRKQAKQWVKPTDIVSIHNMDLEGAESRAHEAARD